MVLVPVVLGMVVTFLVMGVGVQAVQLVVAVLASAMVIVGLLLLAMSGVSLNRGHEALASSQAWAHSLVDEAPDAVFVADLNGRYIDVNGAGCRMLGYTRDEILDRTIVDMIRPRTSSGSRRSASSSCGARRVVAEWQLRRKDGVFITVEISAKIFPDGRWQAMVRDITERKRLEQDLRTAQAEQTFLASSARRWWARLATARDRRGRFARLPEPRLAEAAARARPWTRTASSTPAPSAHRDPAKAEALPPRSRR